MIKELFQPDLLLIVKNGKIVDYSDYFTMLFNKQESFGNPLVEQKYFGLYTPDHNSGSLKARSFSMNGTSWAEFQNWIDNSYSIAKPFNLIWATYQAGNLSKANAVTIASAAGVYNRPVTGGFFSGGPVITTMTASDGHVVGTGLTTDAAWETAYNTLLIPYERSINSAVSKSLRYIKNLSQFGDLPGVFRTSTLKFDGTSV